jgi:hypothetical protein
MKSIGNISHGAPVGAVLSRQSRCFSRTKGAVLGVLRVLVAPKVLF